MRLGTPATAAPGARGLTRSGEVVRQPSDDLGAVAERASWMVITTMRSLSAS
jgi:hypothetical protein